MRFSKSCPLSKVALRFSSVSCVADERARSRTKSVTRSIARARVHETNDTAPGRRPAPRRPARVNVNRRFAPPDQVGRTAEVSFKRTRRVANRRRVPPTPADFSRRSVSRSPPRARVARAPSSRAHLAFALHRRLARARRLSRSSAPARRRRSSARARPARRPARRRHRVPLRRAPARRSSVAAPRAVSRSSPVRAFVRARRRARSRVARARASRTSGRNARKPSSKSSCPRRHRRTRSITPSGVSLRRSTARRVSRRASRALVAIARARASPRGRGRTSRS